MALHEVTFRHHAMATRFSLTVMHPDARYAHQAAAAACGELEGLEQHLSRFRDDSDVARIARASMGQQVSISADTLDCLRIAQQVEDQTHGAFRVTFRDPQHRPTGQLLEIHRLPPAVRPLADRVPVDLGGIGKGLALDRMAALLADWDVSQYLLRASHSTMLAGQPPPGRSGWQVMLGPPTARHTLRLREEAVSGSGTAVKGRHIVDPRTGLPVGERAQAWAAAPTAAQADALSTAAMVMTQLELQQLCQRHPQYRVWV